MVNPQKRFSDHDGIESDIHLFQNQFDCTFDDMSGEPQLELIDFQANDLLKACCREWKLVEFYRCLPDDEFPKLKKFADGIASNLSCLGANISKNEICENIGWTDKQLKAILLSRCRNSKPNMSWKSSVSFTNLTNIFGCLVCEMRICAH